MKLARAAALTAMLSDAQNRPIYRRRRGIFVENVSDTDGNAAVAAAVTSWHQMAMTMSKIVASCGSTAVSEIRRRGRYIGNPSSTASRAWKSIEVAANGKYSRGVCSSPSLENRLLHKRTWHVFLLLDF